MPYRIALGISGAPRFYNSSLESQILGLGFSLGREDSIDIFTSVWSHQSSSPNADLSIHNYICNAISNTKHLLKCTVNLVNVDFLIEEQPLCKLFPEEARSQHLYSMFYSLSRNLLSIRSHEIRQSALYDIVIRSRADLSFLNPIGLSNLIPTILEGNFILTQPHPHLVEGTPMMNDQFFVGPSSIMCSLSQVYFASGLPYPEHLVNTESFLRWYVDSLDIKIRLFSSYVSILQRSDYDSSSKKGHHLYYKLKAI